MADFELYRNGCCAAFVLEDTAYSGVVKIAEKVGRDVELVTGVYPRMEASAVVREAAAEAERMPKMSVSDQLKGLASEGIRYVVVPATMGRSAFLDALERDGKVELAPIRGKRECYAFRIVQMDIGAGSAEKACGKDAKEASGKNAAESCGGNGMAEVTLLLIAGSDKRGTIYGLFHLSELMGVSPWVTFADVLPEKKQSVVFTEKDQMVSKEPSVKYRGFFINDEWPAFGSWTFEHFDGFTAKMYDMIFETLLRLKGNYLWPAMWSSSFSLDGPGEANAALADEYGVVMSNSHHEPCLRHSEEWDMVRGEDSEYGNAWNYYTNREGLLRYWRDGLLRSGKYENIITIGMRGERDSSMLGPDASLKQNIDLLKDIITEQRKLIAECVDSDGREIPQMLALYKEVEAYFYGNDGAGDGLRDWDGLDGVTFMLCEDNFGNMRTLPTEDLKDRDGGWGMYYHFDYHGGPVSYEWVNSSYLPKVWDQMTKAYEFGIRDIWIVNVGDLKFNEYPLSFFMDLAYDYETWGVSNRNAPEEYLRVWVEREFGCRLDASAKESLIRVMEGYTKLAHNRKPEAMRPELYHAAHDDEAEQTLCRIRELEQELTRLMPQIPKEAEASFWELVYYPAMGNLNVQKWNLYAGLNAFYAGLGAVAANDYADAMKECLTLDRTMTDQFHRLLDGKWNGMALSKHVGFVTWNDEGCRFPQRIYVDPAPGVRLLAYSKGDGDIITAGGDWTGKVIPMKQFLRPDTNEAELVLLNAGSEAPEFEVLCEKPWLSFSEKKGRIESKGLLGVTLDRKQWEKSHAAGAADPFDFQIAYDGGHIKVKLEVADAAEVADFMAAAKSANTLGGCAYLEYGGLVSIEAEHFAENNRSADGGFERIRGYGRTLSGMKAFPVNRTFSQESAPELVYQVWTKHAGVYDLRIYAAPVNPHQAGKDVSVGVSVNAGAPAAVSLIPENYAAGENWCWQWCEMALNQIRIVHTGVTLQEGMNRIRILALDPGFLLEKLVLVREGVDLPKSYLGPAETYYMR